MAKITDIEGIGQACATKLAQASVTTTGRLLTAAATAAGRKDLAKSCDLTTKQVLEWVNRADLMRISGVGTQYSDLLEASGVDTVVELATRNAENLWKKMTDVNASKRLVRQVPSLAQVKSWVAQAADLPRVVTH